KPPPSVPTALPRLLLPLLRRMMPRYRTTRIELRAAEGTEPEGMRTGPLLVYALRALMLAYDRKKLLIRAHRRAANGTLVLSDRYPTRQPGVPEGAMLHFLREDPRSLYRWPTMDSIPLLALAVIAAVPALFIAARIFLYPITGLCLWVLLLPVTKTMADLVGYPPGEGPIVLQKLTLGDPVLLLTLAGL